LNPALLKELNWRAARDPNPEMPLIMDEGIDPSAEQFLCHELGEFGGRALSDLGYDVAGMPDDQVIGLMPDSGRQRMWVGLRQNFIHILNFVRHGRKTFYFQGNVFSRLAGTELNVDNELVEPPFRSYMFVYDDQLIRGAFYALSGLPVPDAGAIAVYLSKIRDLMARFL
jgi:hypothetical protein